MSNEEKLIRRYRAIAYGYGFKRDAEDIAQEAVLGALENPQWKQTPRQRVVDAIRKLYGRDVGHGIPNPLQCRVGGENEEKILESLTQCREEDRDNRHRIKQVVDSITGEDRAIFVLKHVWGFSEKEIGYCFNVSESRVSQRLKRVEEETIRNLAQKEQVALQVLRENSEIKAGSQRKGEDMRKKIQRSEGFGVEQDKDSSLEEEEPFEVESYHEEGFPEWFA